MSWRAFFAPGCADFGRAHQHARLRPPQAYAQVNAVGPHVDVVAGGQITLAERGVILLPLLGEPGDRRWRQPGRRAEELLQRGHEVAGRQAVEIEQRQHLGDLRGLAAPGRQNRRREPLALARGLIDALVIHARGLHLDHPGRGRDLPRLVIAIAHDQATPGLITLVGQLGYVGVDFGLQGGSEHAPRALTDDVIDQEAGLRCSIGIHYAQHGRAFPADGATSAYSMTRNRSLGKVRPSRPTRGRSTSHEHCSRSTCGTTNRQGSSGARPVPCPGLSEPHTDWQCPSTRTSRR